ncbi:hypothetical protein I7I50_11074 [Histoplasma capsulatum G186AR]|uniref:Uncharacterized protein n=1 Tax=Ajellomyces capsulatus TaxID=5037 RepID=A0A8H8D745_AJECA|nr:hypothetical protein I7I52_02313 [Histoplasma capsulatum]QSS69694.1 hypothetical protein I7I50_11074 [Histoplasma capsulatum G186AR]
MTVMSLSMQRRQTYSKPTFSPPANNVMHCQPLDCDRCGGAETDLSDRLPSYRQTAMIASLHPLPRLRTI